MTVFNGFVKGGTVGAPPIEYTRIPRVLDNLINFGSTTQPNSGFPSFTPSTPTISANAAADTVPFLTIPAGCVVTLAGFEVVTADTLGVGTLQVTDGTNTYTAATTVQTVGIKPFTAAANRLYTAPTNLSFLVATAGNNAVVRGFAVVTDINGVDSVIDTI